MCAAPAKLTSLQITWDVAMDLAVGRRDWLVKKLNEQRDKEIQAMKRSS